MGGNRPRSKLAEAGAGCARYGRSGAPLRGHGPPSARRPARPLQVSKVLRSKYNKLGLLIAARGHRGPLVKHVLERPTCPSCGRRRGAARREDATGYSMGV